ncbi:MAG: dihydropteroate synthase [Bacteroidetes bacterium]|nr:dihydropteroate synthase [Bacteroidota bacterium]
MRFKSTFLPVQNSLQSHGQLLDLSRPIVMGILNATPDSFYNQGRGSALSELLSSAEKMIADGATILDVGGASTKPGATMINPSLEINRVLPLIKELHNAFPEVWLSIDTYHAQVAIEAVKSGAFIVNDVSSGRFDPYMMKAVAQLKVPYIAMHMQGTPETMQRDPLYNDVVFEVQAVLKETVTRCHQSGILDIVIDPGFGFGKTVVQNFEILQNMHSFRILGRPILAGISRKSMICKTLSLTPDEALNGTTALHMIALQQGASILRAHDVREAMQAIKLFEYLQMVD